MILRGCANLSIKRFVLYIILLYSFTAGSAIAGWSGSIGLEGRHYEDAQATAFSAFIKPDMSWESKSRSDMIFAEFYFRKDDSFQEHSFFDVRELLWVHFANSWDLSLGIGKVFWGVTESNHLVDIINQSDFSYSLDGEEKLGQPMIKWTTADNWGQLDLFLLPYFRNRRFAAQESPLSGGFEVDKNSTFESENGKHDLDFAARYNQFWGELDVGLSYFYGTSREPILSYERIDSRPLLLEQHYPLISHAGLSLQATVESNLWKLEAISRREDSRSYSAMVAGVEHSLFGLAGTAADLGLIMEYSYDERTHLSSTLLQDDLFLGARLTLNDSASSSFLLGSTYDFEYHSQTFSIEADRRIGSSFMLAIEAVAFSAKNADALESYSSSDYASLTLEYFY